MYAILKDRILVSLIEGDDFLDIVDRFVDFVEDNSLLNFDNAQNLYLKRCTNKIQIIKKKVTNSNYFLFNQETKEEEVISTYYLIKSELDMNSISSLFTTKRNLETFLKKN